MIQLKHFFFLFPVFAISVVLYSCSSGDSSGGSSSNVFSRALDFFVAPAVDSVVASKQAFGTLEAGFLAQAESTTSAGFAPQVVDISSDDITKDDIIASCDTILQKYAGGDLLNLPIWFSKNAQSDFAPAVENTFMYMRYYHCVAEQSVLEAADKDESTSGKKTGAVAGPTRDTPESKATVLWSGSDSSFEAQMVQTLYPCYYSGFASIPCVTQDATDGTQDALESTINHNFYLSESPSERTVQLASRFVEKVSSGDNSGSTTRYEYLSETITMLMEAKWNKDSDTIVIRAKLHSDASSDYTSLLDSQGATTKGSFRSQNDMEIYLEQNATNGTNGWRRCTSVISDVVSGSNPSNDAADVKRKISEHFFANCFNASDVELAGASTTSLTVDVTNDIHATADGSDHGGTATADDASFEGRRTTQLNGLDPATVVNDALFNQNLSSPTPIPGF